MLIIIPFATQADNKEPRYITVPYYPTAGDEIPMDDEAICEKQARISAKALQNAQVGVALDEQLEVWDTFATSLDGMEYTALELYTFRSLITMSWDIYSKYPNLDPNELGDYVYGACVSKKLTNKTVKF
jgi:hypothetical protein